MKAALVVPTALSGKALKVVTRYFDSKSSGPCKPLLGKEYDDNMSLITIIKDIIDALGGTYTELDIDVTKLDN